MTEIVVDKDTHLKALRALHSRETIDRISMAAIKAKQSCHPWMRWRLYWECSVEVRAVWYENGITVANRLLKPREVTLLGLWHRLKRWLGVRTYGDTFNMAGIKAHVHRDMASDVALLCYGPRLIEQIHEIVSCWKAVKEKA